MSHPITHQLHVQTPPSESTDQCHEDTNPNTATCRVEFPKSRHHHDHHRSNHRMKSHNVIESLLASKPPSLSSFSSPAGETVPSPNNNKSNNHARSNEKKQYARRSSASLVVCGVDGTVFTLDAFTGQLRGMFASGPALVYSSNAMKDEDDLEMQRRQEEDEYGNYNVITTRHPWKERVVPGLDGRLYSLYEQNDGDYAHDDEEEGQIPFECQSERDMDENDDFLEELCNSNPSHEHNLRNDPSTTSIAPKMDQYTLQALPISVMDVIDSPISTCRPILDFSEAFEGIQKQQCGIVVGSKKTTVYAIDPITGKVRWTQDPHGGGGAKGYTTGRPADAGGKPTVLLQREDFAVRHLDAEGGGEVWKVELGKFSALDFDVDAHRRSEEEEDVGEDPVVVGGRGRGAAAAAARAGVKEKQRGKMPPILGGRRKKFGSSFQEDAEFESDEFEFNYEYSNSRAFPSIAFGEDGTSILAVDSISGELLWKRHIESVVAAVYGVGKTSTWVPLTVIEESEVLTHGNHQSASLLSSSSATSTSYNGGLVPYGANQFDSDQPHRLGRHQNHMFVSSKFDSLGINPPPFPESDVIDDAPDYIDEHGDMYDEVLPPKQAPLFSNVPYSLPPDVAPPVSHRTEHGLYLTWSMISAILALLLSLVVYARIYYLRQKKKWENTPTLAPTAPNSYEDHGGTDQSMSPRGNFLPATSFADEKRSFPGTPWWKVSSEDANTQPPARSLSMGAIGIQSETAGKPFLPEKEPDSNIAALSPKPNAMPLFRDNKNGAKSLAGNSTTATPTMTRSLTVPDDEDSNKPDIDNIDGVPLVRYSRYRSEFKELSALGRGGFGTVFKCENALDSREYAIKKIWIKSQMLDGKVTKHFSQKLHRVLREVKILALLDHPNIVRYYTAWLEVDNEETKTDDEESNMPSSRASPSIFSGFGSNSRGPSLIFKAGGSLFSKSNKGISSYIPKSNPLGWNNFGSFRMDESKSTSKLSHVHGNTASFVDASRQDDLGFVWERTDENTSEQSLPAKQVNFITDGNNSKGEDDKSSSGASGVSSVDSKESTEENRDNLNARSNDPSTTKLAATRDNVADQESPQFTIERKHVLYIQMQLCSVQTLADFLGNRKARMANLPENHEEADCYAVDIPFALRLFSQITHGVKYVHKQGLIHRDLKPQNCFIDDAGNAKVGDFGLSRESSTVGGISAFDEADSTDIDPQEGLEDIFGKDAENTAGVGTRAYASPEQMKGSNYDASTDIYSLGIILFEMCYPLYTTHERYKEFCGIRKGQFPAYWNSNIRKTFPSLHDLILRMLSLTPSKRPSAADVSEHIDKMLAEYSVQSLDKSWGKKGAILLRVETDEAEGVLSATMKLIRAAAPHVTILQYGLRGQSSRAIMEFAMEIPDEEKSSLEKINSSLRSNNMIVRQISNR